MNVLIIEDETAAAQALQSLMAEIDAGIRITAILQTIDESVEWFKLHPVPDLVLMDIHLADGSSFNIFNEVDILCPIIFTTAYDEYALKAFEVNSIAYLLKPVSKNELERALNKYRLIKSSPVNSSDTLNRLLATLKQKTDSYKSCFLVPEKEKLIPLPVSDIACICIDTKVVKAITFNGRTCFLDQTLDNISVQLAPEHFFRANRQYIIARKAVKDLSLWFGGKITVNLTVSVPEKIIVSKVKAAEVKRWIAG